MTEVVARFKDFTRSEEPVTFRIGPDVFTCVPEVPLDVLMEMSALATAGMENTSRTEMMTRIYSFFEGIMMADSYATFRARMSKNAELPIGMFHFRDIMQWMMEVYGLRPTQPSSQSADGSDDSEASSTDGASPTESTS